MKSLLAAAILALAPLTGAATAATVNALDMKQNEWVVFDLRTGLDQVKVTPTGRNGSFSYSASFSDTACPQAWACLPGGLEFGTAYKSQYLWGGFGYGWDLENHSSVTEDVLLAGAASNLYLFFRVTSGSVSLTQSAAAAITPLAPVPLPASALLLAGGIAGLAFLRKRRKTA